MFDETGSLVYGLSLRMLRNREDADEILLDVYGRAWRNAATFDPNRGSVRSWLVMMARSLAASITILPGRPSPYLTNLSGTRRRSLLALLPWGILRQDPIALAP